MLPIKNPSKVLREKLWIPNSRRNKHLKLDLYDKNNLQIQKCILLIRILSETSIPDFIRHASVILSAGLHL